MENRIWRELPEQKEIKPTWTEENLARAESYAQHDKDSFGFAFEAQDEFSEEPLGFEEYTAGLLEDLDDIYTMTGIFNRFSPNYLASCGLFEKVVSRLGRCCVTRALLEQKGFSFPKIEALSVGRLYASVSFNFRKCHAALQEGKSKNIFDFKLLDLECRMYALAERLKTTAEKIQKIRDGKIRADAMLNNAEVIRQLNDPQREKQKKGILSGSRKASSLPVLGSMAREIIQKNKPPKPQPMPRDVFTAKPFPILKEEDIPQFHAEIKADLAKQIRESGKPEREMTEEEKRIMMEVWNEFTGKTSETGEAEKVRKGTPRKEPRAKRKKKKR